MVKADGPEAGDAGETEGDADEGVAAEFGVGEKFLEESGGERARRALR